MGGRLGYQNAAVASGAGNDPRRAAIVEFPTLLDRLVGGKHQHLGRGPGVGNDNRHPPFPSGGPIRTIARRTAHWFENSWSQISVLMYIDDGGGQKVLCGS